MAIFAHILMGREIVKDPTKYIGKICGSFEIISYVGKNEYGNKHWLARCKCGVQRKLRTSLISGGGKRKATQCDCCTKRNGVLANQTQEIIPNRFWRRFLDQAKRRKLVVDFSIEDAYSVYLKQNKRCILTGEDLYFTKFRTNFNRYTNASIDRIDSSLPYTISNVQWVHKTINMMKGSLSQSEFINWCSKVSKMI